MYFNLSIKFPLDTVLSWFAVDASLVLAYFRVQKLVLYESLRTFFFFSQDFPIYDSAQMNIA